MESNINNNNKKNTYTLMSTVLSENSRKSGKYLVA